MKINLILLITSIIVFHNILLADQLITFAHRCAPLLQTFQEENSINSIKNVLDFKKKYNKPDGIEFDIRLSKDNHVVVIHDEILKRTTNNDGQVSEYMLAELKLLSLSDGQKIPTLVEVLNVIDQQCIACIELKTIEVVKNTAGIIQDYISRGWKPELFKVISFLPEALQQFSAYIPIIETGLLVETIENTEDVIEQTKNIQASYIISYYPSITATAIMLIHQAGLKLFACVVNDKAEIERLTRIGIDGVASDNPTLFLADALI